MVDITKGQGGRRSLTKAIPLSLVLFLLASALTVGAQEKTGQESRAKDKKKAGEKKTEEKTVKPEAEKPFQLENITVDVVGKARNSATPNMTVVKPEYYPLSLGTSLDTALERQPGVDVQRIQEIGSALDDDSIRIRGFGARRIAVFSNGRPLSTSGAAGGYFIDWTTIPLAGVERIELVKGVSDARWGNVLGGAVNLVGRRPSYGRPVTELQAGLSSFDSLAFNFYHGWKPGRFDYSLSSSFNDSDGYLRNGDFNFKNAGLSLGYDLPFGGRLSADVSYSRVRKGFVVSNRLAPQYGDPSYDTAVESAYPASDGEYMYGGMGAYAEDGSYWTKTRWMFTAGYEQNIGRSGFLRLNAWKNHGDREAWNTREALDRVFHKKFYDDRSYGFSGEYSFVLGGQPVKAGFDYSRLKDDGDTNYADDFRAPFRNGYYVSSGNFGAYLTSDLRLAGGRLVVTPGLRWMSYDGTSGPGGHVEGIPDVSMSGLAPSVKLTWLFNAENFVYLSLARALRFPTTPEVYWHYDPDDAGVNTSALPFNEEDGLMVQGGWKYAASERTRFEFSAYYYSIDNYIQFDLINYISYNIDRARIYGLEAEISHRFSKSVTAFANGTLTGSRTYGDTFMALFVDPAYAGFDEVPGLPSRKANIGVRWQAPNSARIALYAQAVSKARVVYSSNELWTDDLKIVDQKGYVRLDIEASYPLTRIRARVSGFVRNILNASYQERLGFPAAGRTFGLSLKFTI